MALWRYVVVFIKRLVQPCVDLFTWSFHGCVYFFLSPEGFVSRRRFLRGLPALFVALFALVCYSVATVTSPNTRGWILNDFNAAVANQTPERAVRIGQRLISDSRFSDPETLFEVSELHEKLGDTERSSAMIDLLAPEQVKGYWRAHQKQAMKLAPEISRSTDSEVLRSAFWHLTHSGHNDRNELLRGWAEYSLRVGDINRALRWLEKLSLSDPQQLFGVADLAMSLGDEQTAHRSLEKASRVYAKSIAQNPTSKSDRIYCALAFAKLHRMDKAIETMASGWRLTQDKDFADGIAELHVLQFDLDTAQHRDPKFRFEDLRSALKWNNRNEQAHDRLVTLYRSEANPELRNEIRQFLHALTIEHPGYEVSYFTLSTLEIIDERNADAITTLRRVVALSPNLAPALNNLAWLLSEKQPGEKQPGEKQPGENHAEENLSEEYQTEKSDPANHLEQAAEMARRAVTLDPSHSSYRDTLGTILLKQDKLSEAVVELELALKDAANPASIHRKLADAYRRLSQPEIAAAHESRAMRSVSKR
ncbi:MAG: tetratricopeptide repeat protein [Pirellula sp.]|jgi:tetratricopeptide (TPR) repeat protein